MVKKNTKTRNTVSVFGKQIPSWVIVFGLVVAVTFGFIGYNAYLNYQDQQKFTQLEETVDTLVDRVTINDPGTQIDEINNRCYESSEKLKKGPTICVYEKQFSTDQNKEELVGFLKEQTDIVYGSNELFNALDFWTASEDFSCSFSPKGNQYSLECSEYAQKNYYPFID